jgi:hypothetical protein
LKTHRWLLLCLAIACASCKSTPRADSGPSQRPIPLSQSLVEHEPQSLKLEPGDRIEATVVRLDYYHRMLRLRAVVDAQGMVDLAELGVHHAAGRTTRMLEQTLLKSFNSDGQLRGTVRVVMAPPAHDGFFITPTPEDFAAIMNDRIAVELLDADQHATWQWMRVSDGLAASLGGVSAYRDDGRLWTLTAPAHPELISGRLAANVDGAWTVTAPGATGESMLLELTDPAAVAMESVAQRNGGRRMLLVVDDEVIDAPMIESVRDNHVQLSGIAPGQRPRVMSLFSRVN